MTAHYGEARHWVAVRLCPGCGADHPEQEFKRQEDGTYLARCWRGKAWLTFNPDTGTVSKRD